MSPMISAPTIGTTITHGPSVCASGVISAVLTRWKKKRLVKSPISFRSPSATNALTTPILTANRLMTSSRGVAVKSPRLSAISRICLDMPAGTPSAMVVEEHTGSAFGGLHPVDDAPEQPRQSVARPGRKLLQGRNQCALRGAGRCHGETPPSRGQHEFEL